MEEEIAKWQSVIEIRAGECIESRKLVGGAYLGLISKNTDLSKKGYHFDILRCNSINSLLFWKLSLRNRVRGIGNESV